MMRRAPLRRHAADGLCKRCIDEKKIIIVETEKRRHRGVCGCRRPGLAVALLHIMSLFQSEISSDRGGTGWPYLFDCHDPFSDELVS